MSPTLIMVFAGSTETISTIREQPSIGSCLDINSLLPNFKSQLKDAVNLPTVDTYLDQFKLQKGVTPNAVFNFQNLGQTLANMSDAIQWGENKQYADQALNKANAGASTMLNALADAILSINFRKVAQTLENAAGYAEQEPVGIDGSYAVELVNLLSESVNTTRLGTAVMNLSKQFSLQDLGNDLDVVKGNLDFGQLVGVLAGLPNAVDFYRAGQLISGMAGSFNFADIGSVVNEFLMSAGTNLQSCNST